MKKILLIVLASLALLGCRKDSNDPPIPPDGIAHYLGKLTLQPLQVAVPDLSAAPQFSAGELPFGLLVRKDAYDNGNLSLDTVLLGRRLDLRFFVAPDKPAGEYVLHIPTAGKDYLKLDLTLQPPAPIADPAAYLTAVLDSVFAPEAELENIGKTLEGMPFAGNYAKDIARLNYHKNAARNWVNVCNAQEKAAIAKFIKANESVFLNAFNPLELIDSTNLSRCIHPATRDQALTVTAYTIAFVTSMLVFYESVELLIASGIGTVEGLALAAITAGISVHSFRKLKSMFSAMLDKGFECHNIYVDNIIDSRNGYELISNKDYALATSVEWRTLYKGDLGSTDPVIAGFIDAMSRARDGWNLLKSLIPKFLEGEFPHVDGIDDFKTIKLNEGAAQLRVENGSNPLVILKKTKVVNDQLVVTFTTGATTTQDFSFDVVFDSESTILRKTVPAKLIPLRLPAVQTLAASNITASSAQSGGNVTDDGGANVTERGVCWSTSPGPTISGNHTQNGSGKGAFSSTLSGLTDNTTYYLRAYATNNQGTGYGDEINFTTTNGCGAPPEILNFTSGCQNNRITTEITFIDPDGPGIEINAQVTEWVIPYQQFYGGAWNGTGNYITAYLKSGNLSNGVLVVTEVISVGCTQSPQNPIFVEIPTKLALTDKCGNKSNWITFTASFWSH